MNPARREPLLWLQLLGLAALPLEALLLLLVSVPLLALMLWQWQQLIQAVWMFTRPATLVEQTLPLTQAVASETRLNAGLPLLLLPPLVTEAPAEPPATPQPAPFAATEPVQVPEPAITEPETDTIEEPPAPEAEESDVAQAQAEPAQRDVEQPEPDAPHGAPTASEPAVIDAGVAITPEQSTEEDQSTHLDS